MGAAATATTLGSWRSTRSSTRPSAIHRRLGCPVLDVSELSIEETAHRIIRLVEERRRDREAAATATREGASWQSREGLRALRRTGRSGARSSAAAIVVFYVLLTPVWMGIRAAAWVAEFKARRRPAPSS